MSFSAHSLSEWYIFHYYTSVYDIRSNLNLGFTLHQAPSVSGRCSQHNDQLSLVLAFSAVSGYVLLSPPILRRISSSANCFYLDIMIESLSLLPLYPLFFIIGLFCLLYGAWSFRPPSSSSFVSGVCPLRPCTLLCRYLSLCLLVSPFLLLHSLLWEIDITGINCQTIASLSLPFRKTRTSFQGFHPEFFSSISSQDHLLEVQGRS